MNIERINSYSDCRFSQKVLYQHGCFLADGEPYEIEIISDYEESQTVIKEYPRVKLLELHLDDIQPSQFYVDQDKIDAIGTFIERGEAIIIQVSRHQGRYISLDGHTRLYYAVMKGFETVRAVMAETDDCIFDFVEEAQKRNIFTPKDLLLVSHKEYEEKWNQYCDEYFSNK